jgi:glycosyltransferase involved in cell wall biosynthesis
MRKLRIAQVAPLWYPVPPKGYGGTELIVHLLTEELVRRGHRVTLFASGDSKTKGRLSSIIPKSLTASKVPWTVSGFNLLNLERAMDLANRFDIVHTHIDPFDGFFRANLKVPSVATLHNHFWPFNAINRPKYYDRVMIYERFKRLPYIAISDAYRRACPVKLNFVSTIHHGIEPERFSFNAKPRDRMIWFGRITPIKGLHNAVAAVNRAGAKLDISGPFITEDAENYFEREVRHHVDGDRIRYVGEKTRQNKAAFLRSGKALLYPIEWDEPFGIVMVEAMACGTPVIAFRRGSVPEVVRDGVSGFVVDSVSEMAEAIRDIGKIDRRACRRWAEDNFSVARMVDRHEEVYRKVIRSFRK